MHSYTAPNICCCCIKSYRIIIIYISAVNAIKSIGHTQCIYIQRETFELEKRMWRYFGINLCRCTMLLSFFFYRWFLLYSHFFPICAEFAYDYTSQNTVQSTTAGPNENRWLPEFSFYLSDIFCSCLFKICDDSHVIFILFSLLCFRFSLIHQLNPLNPVIIFVSSK